MNDVRLNDVLYYSTFLTCHDISLDYQRLKSGPDIVVFTPTFLVSLGV